MHEEVRYWQDYAIRLEAELARYRLVPSVPSRDFFMGCALLSLLTGPTFRDPEEAADIVVRFAGAVMARRAAPPVAQEGTTE